MGKMQRQYKIGSVYSVVGASKKERKLLFVARLVIDGKEHLVFKEQRAAKKRK